MVSSSPGADVAHGDQDDVAREAHVRLAGMIDEEHDRLVLCVLYGGQVKAAGNLDPGVLQAFRQGPQRSGSDDVTAFDRDELAGGGRRHGNQSAARDRA